MCGVYGQNQLRFNAEKPLELAPAFVRAVHQKQVVDIKSGEQLPFKPAATLWVGGQSLVITAEHPHVMQYMVFGLTPFWSQKRLYLFNARTEGKENSENAPDWQGEPGIWRMPSFREAVAKRRCLVPVDYFLEGPEKEKLSKPYLIERKDQEPFFLAGIWDEWHDPSTGQEVRTFSILTTPAAPLLQKVGHHRSPLVLSWPQAALWLNPEGEKSHLLELMRPFDSSEFRAFPISAEIKKDSQNPRWLQPIGPEV
jgi:putative SOS response-associated peptidase YedK